MKAKFLGPYTVRSKVSDLNYLIDMPDRLKKQMLCHINMIKPYYSREVKPVLLSHVVIPEDVSMDLKDTSWPGNNSDVLANLNEKLGHLDGSRRGKLCDLIYSFPSIFKDSPGRTHLIEHDVDVEEKRPIKQHPYRLNPLKSSIVEKEVDYMLQNRLIKPSFSPWSSPVVLVPKDNNQHRMCFDYRKVNQMTKTDTFPLPRVDDCIDKIGNAKFISKFDLMKGYWQVPLTQRARAISAFVTPNGLYECEVMPFGMKNAAATFQRLMTYVTRDIENCVVYIDDVVIFSDTWEKHIELIEVFFLALRKANLVVNLSKSDFCKAQVIYLGHEIGLGEVAPKMSNVQAIIDFPIPKNRKNIMQFLGLAGYYRKFVSNFSDLVYPISELLKKDSKFVWDESCDQSFRKLKAIMISRPVLKAPDFASPFQLSVDASDTGVGAMLTQFDESGHEHPVAYFSKKLDAHQKNYATIEKEALALLLALSHFEVYVTAS